MYPVKVLLSIHVSTGKCTNWQMYQLANVSGEWPLYQSVNVPTSEYIHWASQCTNWQMYQVNVSTGECVDWRMHQRANVLTGKCIDQQMYQVSVHCINRHVSISQPMYKCTKTGELYVCMCQCNVPHGGCIEYTHRINSHNNW